MIIWKNFIWNVVIAALIIWGILIFFGYFDLIKNVEYNDAEPIIINNTPQYVIIINFLSKGAFIEGKPIDFNIEVQKIDEGKKFVTGPNQFWLDGSCPVYRYPLKKGALNLYEGGLVELNVTENGDKLIGHDTVLFSKSGECDDFKLRYHTEIGGYTYLPNYKIYISPANVGLDIEFNQRLLSLTLIMLSLTLIEFGKNIRKEKTEEKQSEIPKQTITEQPKTEIKPEDKQEKTK